MEKSRILIGIGILIAVVLVSGCTQKYNGSEKVQVQEKAQISSGILELQKTYDYFYKNEGPNMQIFEFTAIKEGIEVLNFVSEKGNKTFFLVEIVSTDGISKNITYYVDSHQRITNITMGLDDTLSIGLVAMPAREGESGVGRWNIQESTPIEKDIVVKSNLVADLCTAEKLQYRLEKECRDAFKVAGDPIVCDQMEKYEDDCYKYYAEKFSDIKLCDKINYLADKDACYENIAVKEKDKSLCAEIDNSNNYPYDTGADCYYKIAVLQNDGIICDLIKEKSAPYDRYNFNIKHKKAQCYYEVALNTNNPALCNKLDEVASIDVGNYYESKSFCYFKIALKTKDNSLCENVKTLTVTEITPDPNAPPCRSGPTAGTCGTPVIKFNWTMSNEMCRSELKNIHLDLTCPLEAPNCSYDTYNMLINPNLKYR
ncbi:TPA: hypothetical protein H1016_02175 [archaeon]|uniref:Lipoprotein n=1 Tax=Candidatus Naiadarchaeum limnaeum TaxID=2756139 RepID=A0A832V3I0_9ARCH|nr:hypothetical protein [Candidatus Naiadarchaeum limnaeum]